MEIGDLKFRCMFCGETIERSGFDVSVVVLITNSDDSGRGRREQQFFCHADCFRQHSYSQVDLYIFDDDF